MTWQDEVFVERLDRLSEIQAHRTRRSYQRGTSTGRLMLDIGQFLSLLSAGAIGLISVPLLRFAMFHSQGLPDTPVRPGLTLMVDAIFAFCFAFFLVRILMSVTARAHMVAQMIGIWVALTTMHNLVHAYPEPWSVVFSPDWVARVVQITEPNTFYLVGLTFP